MKLLLKPFKLIFKILIGILIIPAILLALLWKPIKVPTEDYSDQTVNLENEVTNSVDTFLEDPNNKLNFTLDAKLINNELRNQLLEQFNNVGSEETNYVYEEGNIKFQGAWVDFKKDTVNIRAGVHIDAKILTFKTSLLLKFKVVHNDGVLTLKLSKINIGRIPFAWASGFASTIIEKFSGQDLETMLEQQFGGLGTFDAKKLELVIDIRELAAQDEENGELMAMLIDLVYGEELIDLGINEVGDGFGLGLFIDMKKLKDETPPYVLNQKINSIDEVLENKLNLDSNRELIETMLSTKPKFAFNEEEVNQILDYFFSTEMNLVNNGKIQEMLIYENYNFTVLAPYLSFADGNTSLNVPIRLGKIGGDEFMTMLKLGVDIKAVDADLIFEVIGVTFGEVEIDANDIEQVMTLFGNEESPFINGTELVITDFANNFEQTGVTFIGLEVESNELLLQFEIAGLESALDDIKNNVDPDIADLIDDVLNDSTNEDTINDLIDSIESLPQNEQDDILAQLQAAFDNMNP